MRATLRLKLGDELEPDIVAFESTLHVQLRQPAQLGDESRLAVRQDIGHHRTDAGRLALEVAKACP